MQISILLKYTLEWDTKTTSSNM